MARSILIVVIILIVIGAVIFGIRFWSGEDNWICQEGVWVKHGNPSAPMPAEPCGGTTVNAQPTNTNAGETMIVKVFFGNSKLDPEILDCKKNFSVERMIPKTEAVGRAALEQLLAGPTDEEKAEGYFTSINPGVVIQSLTIENGVAKVDFNEQLEYQVGGSCRVAAIASQIRETLKQFPTVSDVVISINGRTEDILQP
jgi:spore germination protein GerM